MTLRVAITGISGDVGRGAALGLQRNPASDEPIYVLGLGAVSDFSGTRLVDDFVQLPLVEDPAYIDRLVATLQAYAIEVLLPGIDSEIALLSASRSQLAASGAKVVLAPAKLVEAAHDKLLTAQFLSARGIKTPATCAAESPLDIGFPLVAKPRRGHASQGVAILPDYRALRTFLDASPQDYCLQRQIDGPEITVGFLYDSDGVMCDALAMERTLEGGRTVTARVMDDTATDQFIAHFGRTIPGCGAINAQLRWDKRDGPIVFEINARLSGSTEMRVSVGFNDPLRLAKHFGRGAPIERTKRQYATVRRLGTELVVEPF